MKLLNSSSEIAKSLKDFPPNRIAVAYLGLNWRNYIDVDSIENLVLSPTIGTNPNAVADLVEAVGWEKIYFLPRLHSKIYISKKQIVLGSANLSQNGLGDNEQYEICVLSKDQRIIREASILYESYLKKSKELYPSIERKIFKLNQLWDQYNKKIASGMETKQNISRNFMKYVPELHGNFYVIWYVDGDTSYKTENIPEIVLNEIVSELHFSSEDNIESGKWVLYWKLNKNNTVNQSVNIFWMYIHEIYPDGCDDEGYENLGIQRDSMEIPDEPFKITKKFKKNFTKIVESGQYDEFRDSQGDTWFVKNTFDRFQPFISEIQSAYDD